MNLLDEISNDLVSESASLSNTLRKAKILASRINLPEFNEWLGYELGGYPDSARVPGYRSFNPVNLGTFAGYFGSGVANMTLPTYNLPEPVKEFAENLILGDGVGALEGMLLQNPKGLNTKWPQEYVMLAREALKLADGSVLVDAHRPLPAYAIKGALDEVKNKLLDFILAMKENDIMSDDLSNRTIEPQVVRNLFNVHIHGDNPVVATGENVHQEVSTVRKGDVDSLISSLKSLGVEDDSLQELREAVLSEPDPKNGEFGSKVKEWIGGAIAKSTAGAWQIGISTATKEVIEALNKYYGT